MIIVKLAGGLGNQMFQYAMARRLALLHGAELALDMSSLLSNIPGVTPRQFELSNLAIKAREATVDEIAELSGCSTSNWMKLKVLLRQVAGRRKYESNFFRESSACSFCEEVLNLPDNVYLEGYWQSENYFEEISDLLRREFSVVPPMDKSDMAMAELMEQSDAVAVHFRRGDYVYNEDVRNRHGIPPIEYYCRALDLLLAQLRDPTLFIFSDDPDWVKANVSFPVRSHIVTHNRVSEGYKDLRLMSLCRHAIIANSTFSWWGAWLIDNPAKIVIAPHRWFTTSDGARPAILPAAWMTVDWL